MKQDFIDNAAYITIFKSNRKNAKCANLISVHHLISHNDNRMISDDRILLQFVRTLDAICANAENLGAKQFIIKTTVFIGKNAIRTPEKTDCIMERLTYDLRLNTTSITMLISYLFNIFVLIYPYTMLSRETILTNPSVKCIINKYGINDKFGKKWKYTEAVTK